MSFTASLSSIVAENPNQLLGVAAWWRRVPLGCVAEILNGFPFESERFTTGTGFPLIRIRDLLRGRTDTRYAGDYNESYVVRPGELLVGMDGDFNAVLWTGGDGLLNQRVCKISPRSEFYEKRFLAYVLPGYLAAINAHTSAVTVKHLSSKTVSSIPLPLPPLAEQARIANLLDEQFSRLSASVEALKRVQRNLKRYRASVLKAACEGRLVPTEAELARRDGREYVPTGSLLAHVLDERLSRWRSASKNAGLKRYIEPASLDYTAAGKPPEGWVWATLEQITDAIRVICYGILMPKEHVADGVLYVKVRDLRGDRIDLAGLQRTSPEIAEQYARAALAPGDLLLSIRGTYGRVAEVPGELDGANITQDTARVAVSGILNRQYVACVLRAPQTQNYLKRVARGVAVKGVNIADVRLTPIPVPPIEEQQRIVAEVERRLSTIDKLGEEVEHGLRCTERLRQSILKRAFEGKLVPQDPNDEPASELLERIRATRASQPSTPHRRRTAAK